MILMIFVLVFWSLGRNKVVCSSQALRCQCWSSCGKVHRAIQLLGEKQKTEKNPAHGTTCAVVQVCSWRNVLNMENLSAYARQPARGPTMLAHLVAICWPMLAYVGLSCGQRVPILWLCWPMFASCWSMLSQKIRKMGTAKNAVKRMIFWWSAAYLGAMLAHLGAMLAYLEGNVGPSWGYVGPSWGYLGPSWGYVGPSWGLCWPMLDLCWPSLRPILAHVGPS